MSHTHRNIEFESMLIGDSDVMRLLRDRVALVAESSSTALVLGESGTGKELVARALHALSPNRNEPFVAVNCGAIPPDLMESELFGHERGAFTGAHATRLGRFEAAGRGTLFLDEVAEMSPALQVKLLRVLQERTFERVGSQQARPFEARIVAATHRDLRQCVANGQFREDLYYRLHVVPIHVPPLRERGEDICVLARHAIGGLTTSTRGPVRFDPGVREALLGYAWPGNVRELFNLMERISVLHPGGTIRVDDLPPQITGRHAAVADAAPLSSPRVEEGILMPPPFKKGQSLMHYMEQVERHLIRSTLSEHQGVIAWAADALGMRRNTLSERMKRLGIDRGQSVFRRPTLLDGGSIPARLGQRIEVAHEESAPEMQAA